MATNVQLCAPSHRCQADGIAVHAWYGLRYAQGAGRFEAAQAASGTMGATRLSQVPIFPQRPSRLAAVMGAGSPNPQSEDAYFLNVWAPAQAQGLPVVFFIHGGAWMSGGGSLDWYDGTRLAAQGVIVVNVNYRLGALGHLGDAQADALPLPAADLVLALQWVKDHIRAFGGEPDKITLMGQSAGGWYAHLLSVLDSTRAWIDRLALLSMGTRAPWLPEQQARISERVRSGLGEDWRKVNVDVLMQQGLAALDKEPPRLGHAPSAFLPVASADVPEDLLSPDWAAQACHAQAVYLRCAAQESSVFFFDVPFHRQATQEQLDQALGLWPLQDLPASLVRHGAYCGGDSGLTPYQQVVAASSWVQFQRFPTQYAASLNAAGRAVLWSDFTEQSPLEAVFSGHCFDLPFQFGQFQAWHDAPMMQGVTQEQFEPVAQRLMQEITRFAGA